MAPSLRTKRRTGTTGTTGTDSPASATARAPRPEDERLPLGTTVGYGVQHILAMFGGVIAVPIILGGAAGLSPAKTGLVLSCCLFVSGVATVLQTMGVPFFGSQLPLVQGISFASVSTVLTIIGDHGATGLRTAYGAIIVASLVGLLITPFFSQIVRFFPPVVTGAIITVIGLTLLPVAAGWITGQATIGTAANPDYLDRGNIGLAAFTLLVVLVLTKIPGLSRLSILLGLVIGTLAALLVGRTDFALDGAKVVAAPTPFAFGAPLFAGGAIVSMVIVILVTMVETTADLLAVSEVVGSEMDARRVGDGLRADMLSSAVAPVFNAFPTTAFAQNVGLVALTGIKSRFVVAAGGVILAVLGLSPALAAIVSAIPQPVLGGAGIVLFGTVAASGIRTLSKVDYDGNNNLVVVAVSIAVGLIPVVHSDFWSTFPSWVSTILGSGISAASIAAVLLNVLYNMVAPATPPDPTGVAAAPATLVRADELERLRRGGSSTDRHASSPGAGPAVPAQSGPVDAPEESSDRR